MEAYCRRRWGGSGWTHHLKSEGRKSGADFGNWKWWPNTLKAHQFVQYAVERHGADTDRLNAALFSALYEEGANLSDVGAIVDLARREFPSWSAGDCEDLRRYLDGDAGAGQVKSEIQSGRRKFGVSSVPFFVIGSDPASSPGERPYGMSGAQSSKTFCGIFEELTERNG